VASLGTDMGIDLGTANVLVFLRGKGIVLREPSVVTVDTATGKVLAIGDEARRMVGRTPGHIVAVRPLRDGVIADFEVTETMLRYFIRKVCGRRMLFRPRIMIGIPSAASTVEKRAVIEAATRAGARKTYLIEQPLAASIGAGLDITKPSGNMVVDVGGGTTDVAILSLGGVVLSDSIKVAGDKMDDAIARYVRREFGLMIGERMAEDVKIQAGTAYPRARSAQAEIRGRDLITGLPKTVTITSAQAFEALREPLEAIVRAIRSVLERTPPELAADISEKGMVLTGGGALLHGLDRMVSDETGVPVFLAEDPMSCVAMGTGRALEFYETYHDHVFEQSRVI